MGYKPKIVLCTICGIFLVINVMMIIVGAVAIEAEELSARLLNIDYIIPFVILILTGILAFITSVIGMSAAVRRDRRGYLTVFQVLLSIITISTLVAGIMSLVFMKDVEDKSLENLKTAFGNQGNVGKRGISHAWKIVQDRLECCGVHYPHLVKDRCCKKGTYNCSGYPEANPVVIKRGCYDVVKIRAKKHLLGVGTTGVVLATAELLMLATAVVFIKRLRKDDKKTYREMSTMPGTDSEPPKEN